MQRNILLWIFNCFCWKKNAWLIKSLNTGLNDRPNVQSLCFTKLLLIKKSRPTEIHCLSKAIQSRSCLYSFEVLTEKCRNVGLKSIFTTKKSITENLRVLSPRFGLFYEVSFKSLNLWHLWNYIELKNTDLLSERSSETLFYLTQVNNSRIGTMNYLNLL